MEATGESLDALLTPEKEAEIVRKVTKQRKAKNKAAAQMGNPVKRGRPPKEPPTVDMSAPEFEPAPQAEQGIAPGLVGKAQERLNSTKAVVTSAYGW